MAGVEPELLEALGELPLADARRMARGWAREYQGRPGSLTAQAVGGPEGVQSLYDALTADDRITVVNGSWGRYQLSIIEEAGARPRIELRQRGTY